MREREQRWPDSELLLLVLLILFCNFHLVLSIPKPLSLANTIAEGATNLLIVKQQQQTFNGNGGFLTPTASSNEEDSEPRRKRRTVRRNLYQISSNAYHINDENEEDYENENRRWAFVEEECSPSTTESISNEYSQEHEDFKDQQFASYLQHTGQQLVQQQVEFLRNSPQKIWSTGQRFREHSFELITSSGHEFIQRPVVNLFKSSQQRIFSPKDQLFVTDVSKRLFRVVDGQRKWISNNTLVGQTAGFVGDAYGLTLHFVGDTCGQAVNLVGDTCGHAMNFAGSTYGHAMDFAGNTYNHAFNMFGGTVGSTLNFAGSTLNFAGKTIGQTARFFGSTERFATHIVGVAVKETWTSLSNTTLLVVDGVVSRVDDVWEFVDNTKVFVGDTIDVVRGTVDPLKEINELTKWMENQALSRVEGFTGLPVRRQTREPSNQMNLFNIVDEVVSFVASWIWVQIVKLVVRMKWEGQVFKRLNNKGLLKLLNWCLAEHAKPKIIRLIADELDRRLKYAISTGSIYPFRDTLMRFTGRDTYRMGDLTRSILERLRFHERALSASELKTKRIKRRAKYEDEVQVELNDLEKDVALQPMEESEKLAIRIPIIPFIRFPRR